MSRRQPAYSTTGDIEQAGIMDPHDSAFYKRFMGTDERSDEQRSRILQANPNPSRTPQFGQFKHTDDEYSNHDGTSRRQPAYSGIRNSKLEALAKDARKLRHHILQRISSIGQPSKLADILSTPNFDTKMPFPFVGAIPARFDVDSERNWSYMGRERFVELLNNFKKVKESQHYFGLWLYGTSGYGKSYLLAMLVCYFIADNERVMYIPDCRKSLKDVTAYFREAMFLTWADDPCMQREIMGLKTKDDIYDFLSEKGNDIILVIDMLNGLQVKDAEVNNDRRKEVWELIDRLRHDRKAVLSASANYKTYLQGELVQNSDTTMRVYGGLTPVSHGRCAPERILLTMI
jgi:DNA replication protein DnaC